VRSC
jgi:hypothetical protein